MGLHLIKLACELPDAAGRSLSLWTCAELARAFVRAGVVSSISPQSVQRILYSKKLKPWRVHYWLSPKAPRDEAFRVTVLNLCDLYTRPLHPHERVLCLDEITSLQPRTRSRARKRLAAPNFTDLAELQSEILHFIEEWNESAHPFTWTPKSFEKILAKVNDALRLAA
ncbi:MAG TPA: hypothetical protein VE093_26645 [Polyangiaceae bacterium]|nr:hypothetical protein [Polyangiaceae bacterium]